MKRLTLLILILSVAVTTATGCKKKPKPKSPSDSTVTCGDSTKADSEECDDGNTVDGDGCSASCTIEQGYTCATPGAPCTKGDSGDPNNHNNNNNSTPVCGDGTKADSEECDDGNTDNDDGCSSTCKILDGFTCPTPGQLCEEKPAVCGDSHISGDETCDDGNAKGGDGCSADCKLEDGYKCPAAGQECVKKSALPGCGNGVVESTLGETCDDGNTTGGDGCSALCKAEPGFTCATPGASCTNNAGTCGNGTVEPGEDCDDGNSVNDDECMNNCHTPTCGDGILQGKEKCDDGNTQSGDGCSSDCEIEKGFECTPLKGCFNVNCGNGKLDIREECDDGRDQNTGAYGHCRPNCTLGPRCGDGRLSGANGEECDDGNTNAGDGCSANCKIEKVPGKGTYTCPRAGQACILNTCGNGVKDAGERCDDGNSQSGDGCSSKCTVELGYDCKTPGQPCTAKACGDGKLAGDEECDDGNLRNNDGCNQYCEIEYGWYCPTPGDLCVKPQCGDGRVDGDEECDDGNKNPNDGCSATCQFEPGFKCPTPGQKCVKSSCGDGKREGYETCDDGNTKPGDGCDANCQVESGYACKKHSNGAPSSCHATVCGDGKQEGNEECDDGNKYGGDGCDKNCKAESVYNCRHLNNGLVKCGPVCGDGLTLKDFGEKCDDGNQVAGDGCSPSCMPEKGFVCTVQGTPTGTPGKRHFDLPVLIRDFKKFDYPYNAGADAARKTNLKEHRQLDMERHDNQTCTSQKGLLQTDLGPDGKPVLNASVDCFGANSRGLYGLKNGGRSHAWSLESFYQWYHDDLYNGGGPNTFAKPVSIKMRFEEDPEHPDTFVNRVPLPGGKFGDPNKNDFFPIDGKGWQDQSIPATEREQPEGGHNYFFTTEFTTYFKYKGGERLDFLGDDDLWVFINGKLAVDLGGLNNSAKGSVTLGKNKDSATNKIYDSRYDIFEGGVYEMKIFHAERHTSRSKFKLTLSGFVSFGKSDCVPDCGDGIVAYGAEACDLGTGNSDAKDSLGHFTSGCSSTCTINPGWFCSGSPQVCEKTTCGNGTVEYPEACDPGPTPTSACVDCHITTCGDGTFQPGNGEKCDASAPKSSANDVDHCTDRCTLSSCGDGRVEATEECDDGNNTDNDGCTNSCKLPVCGDGIVQSANGESCDDGVNSGQYGSCTPDCQASAGKCGDSIIQADQGEQCDDGAANGTNASNYGACDKMCQLVSRCGDGVVQSPEVCDDGNDQAGDGCDESCRPEPGYSCVTTSSGLSSCSRLG